MRFKNLTTVIFVAMFIGIAAGYILNVTKVGAIVQNIEDTGNSIQTLLNDSARADSTNAVSLHTKI